jgi:uncharacterized LabA/DUF88 family protein
MCKAENNYAFIDSQNVNLGIRELGWRLDFQKFRIYLKEKYDVQKAYIFIGYIPANNDLYLKLRDFGYILIFKPTVNNLRGIVKGNCDAELVLHAMIEYPNYDRAIIATADGDFQCLAKYLKEMNKLLKIVIPNQNRYSALLKDVSTEENNFLDFMNTLERKLGATEK